VGEASLRRRDAHGDPDVGVPEVSAADYGTMAFGEQRVVDLPAGWIVLDVVGFEVTDRCAGNGCTPDAWTGRGFVWVGGGAGPEGYVEPDLVVSPGISASLDIEVAESCECID
jgi:hypothetical protein